MKDFIHLCFTSHNEVMFRDADDVGMMLNFIALCSWKYNVGVLADAEMSTHVHMIVYGGNASDRLELSAFVNSLRKRYTCYFNRKYRRSKHNRFGERGFFWKVIYGNAHMQTAMSYVLRNPWHHGVSATPFAYQFSSVNDMFSKELGKMERPMTDNPMITVAKKRTNGTWKCESIRRKDGFAGNIWCPSNTTLITSRQEMATFLPRYSEWPDDWVMSGNHVFLRPCFEELKLAESLYVTPGAFEYCMFRKTDDKMKVEQNLDNNGLPPIELSDIEPDANDEAVSGYLNNERAGTFRAVQSDFDVCRMIDTQIVPSFGKHTLYELNDTQIAKICSVLEHDLHVHPFRALRCLGTTGAEMVPTLHAEAAW